nr:MAG TPA: hypothetical protein [Bacteriophage sp.]
MECLRGWQNVDGSIPSFIRCGELLIVKFNNSPIFAYLRVRNNKGRGYQNKFMSKV